jgi:hypothetical protein
VESNSLRFMPSSRAFSAVYIADAQALAIVAAPRFNPDAEILAALVIDSGPQFYGRSIKHPILRLPSGYCLAGPRQSVCRTILDA